MRKIKVIHYINQFFANIGGEEKADLPPKAETGPIGPGLALAAALGDEYELTATVICGDTYFGNNMDGAKQQIMEIIKKNPPDLFIAGPAFNAGRYGVACGTICKTVAEELGIPVVTAMYHENPGTEMYKSDIFIAQSGNSARDMKPSINRMVHLAKKLLAKETILSPAEDGYWERGIRVNYFNEQRGSERAVEMLLKKIHGEAFSSEYPMPTFDRVDPAPAAACLSTLKVALVTSGGIVPHGNPDRIESSSATKYGTYSIKGMQKMSKDDFTSIHGGYDRTFILENPNLVIPLDVLRDMEKEGKIGELADYFISTTGTGTSVGNAKSFGEKIAKKLLDEQIGAVILSST